jgi:Zn-dependent peptidase ImmA (M78 family)
MPKPVTGLKPAVLRWARESQGYSVQEVADRLGRTAEEISSWESESDVGAPTYAQLEQLAYKIYKRPLAVFFLPNPPEERNLKQEFRTLPDFEIDRFSPDTRYHLRLAQAFQISLSELNEGTNPTERVIFRDLDVSPTSNPQHTANAIRDYLGITVKDQSEWSSTDEALRNWRNAIENAGIFVFKNSLKQREISAFCLADEQFPIIYLNNSTAKSRQIFSMFHELTHLLMQVNDVVKSDESYIELLPESERRLEQFCNAVTAEFLIPADDFSERVRSITRVDDEIVERLAERYRVSREVVLRRMLDFGLVGPEYYQRKAQEWSQQVEEDGGGRGGNYYLTQATYLGDNYLRLVFGKYYQGKITEDQLADYLGVRTKSIDGLEALVTGRSSS